MKLPDLNEPQETKVKKGGVGLPLLPSLSLEEPVETDDFVIEETTGHVSEHEENYEELESIEDDFIIDEIDSSEETEESVHIDEDYSDDEDNFSMMSAIPSDDFEFDFDNESDVGSIMPIDGEEQSIPIIENEVKVSLLDKLKSKINKGKPRKKGPSKSTPLKATKANLGLIKKIVYIAVGILIAVSIMAFALTYLTSKSTLPTSAHGDGLSVKITEVTQGDTPEQLILSITNESDYSTSMSLSGQAKSGFLGLSKSECSSSIVYIPVGEESTITLTCDKEVSIDSKLVLASLEE